MVSDFVKIMEVKAYKDVVDISMLKEIDTCLSMEQKRLPSWLFYDAEGSRLFQQIMKLPEYYPTACEYEILRDHRDLLLTYFTYGDKSFDLIELGAGDAYKTQLLLDFFRAESTDFRYVPVDISEDILSHLHTRLTSRLPELRIEPVCSRYDDPSGILLSRDRHKVIMFLGASIGNFTQFEATTFLKNVSSAMSPTDLMVVGFDLKKDPRVIQLAYDDPKGITRKFNLNMLTRLNAELDANFNVSHFNHYPVYNPATGTAESFLISKKDQTVIIGALQKAFSFKAWETIHTEISQKYDMAMIEHIATKAGLEVIDVLYDSRKYFCDVILRKFQPRCPYRSSVAAEYHVVKVNNAEDYGFRFAF